MAQDRSSGAPIWWEKVAAQCGLMRDQHMAAITDAARCMGYAVGIHGSQRRDLDLIAAPWVDNASSALDLAEAVRLAVGGTWITTPDGGTVKPCGRRAWSIHIPAFELTFVDLSVAAGGGCHG